MKKTEGDLASTSSGAPTEQKHTPGPWIVDSRRKLRVIAKANAYWPHDGVTVATTGCDESQRNAWEANARLIAAAPQLLDALQQLYDDNIDYIRLNNLGAENNQVLRNARAALAAALGRPQDNGEAK